MEGDQVPANIAAVAETSHPDDVVKKKLAELVAMMGVTLNLDKQRDHLLTEKQHLLSGAERREAESKSRLEENRRTHEAEMGRLLMQLERERETHEMKMAAKETEYKEEIEELMKRLLERDVLIMQMKKDRALAEELQMRCRKLEEENNEMKSNLERVEGKLQKKRDYCDAASFEVARLSDENKSLQKENSALRNQLAYKKSKLKTTTDRLENLRLDYDMLRKTTGSTCCRISQREGYKTCSECGAILYYD